MAPLGQQHVALGGAATDVVAQEAEKLRWGRELLHHCVDGGEVSFAGTSRHARAAVAVEHELMPAFIARQNGWNHLLTPIGPNLHHFCDVSWWGWLLTRSNKETKA